MNAKTDSCKAALRRSKRFMVLLLMGALGTLLFLAGAFLHLLPSDVTIVLPIGAMVGVMVVVGGVGYIFTELAIMSSQSGGHDEQDEK